MTASTGEPAATSSAEAPPPTGPGDIPADTFGARLVLARYHAGRLSIEKAAERCGLNSEGWRRWEDGSKPRDKIEVAQAAMADVRGAAATRPRPAYASYCSVSEGSQMAGSGRRPDDPQATDHRAVSASGGLMMSMSPVFDTATLAAWIVSIA
jgi:hypothetical protein